jgi:hypothetical protein
MRAEDILALTPSGVCCKLGDFHIDPIRPVARALITHGHSDHARAGHGAVLATQETLDLMRLRYGDDFAGTTQAIRYGESAGLGGVRVTFHPAGHVLGSAQIAVEANGLRIVASGDYKNVPDPTCAPFELVACDVFITEATFELLDRLTYEQGRNNKLRLMTDYFRSTADPERGWALAALTGALSFPHAKAGLIRSLIVERTDPVLFELSYDYVGDLSETVALMWPATFAQRTPSTLAGEGGEGGREASRESGRVQALSSLKAQNLPTPTPDPGTKGRGTSGPGKAHALRHR